MLWQQRARPWLAPLSPQPIIAKSLRSWRLLGQSGKSDHEPINIEIVEQSCMLTFFNEQYKFCSGSPNLCTGDVAKTNNVSIFFHIYGQKYGTVPLSSIKLMFWATTGLAAPGPLLP